MKIRTSQWYEVKVRTSEQGEEGMLKDKTTPYVVEACTFSDAEEIAIEEASDYTAGAIEVADIKKARYIDVFFSEDTTDDRWYKTTLQHVIVNEKSGKEKKSVSAVLVKANSIARSLENFEKGTKDSVTDFTITQDVETPIMDVFHYGK